MHTITPCLGSTIKPRKPRFLYFDIRQLADRRHHPLYAGGTGTANAPPKIVISRTLLHTDWHNAQLIGSYAERSGSRLSVGAKADNPTNTAWTRSQ